jgi:DtxR family Mn-dependent transcriptional regulator
LNLSASQEDYLKLIWHLEYEHRKATVKIISDLYTVRPPTVFSMMKQLSRMNLITYNKKDGAVLTVEGDQITRKLVRKHRLVETFLEQILKLDEQFIHDEAERLEHVVSDRLMHRIDEHLGFPKVDPHGAVIPFFDLDAQKQALAVVDTGQTFKVVAIPADEAYNSYLKERDFKVNSVWILSDIIPDGSGFLISDGRRFLVINRMMAGAIMVTVQS